MLTRRARVLRLGGLLAVVAAVVGVVLVTTDGDEAGDQRVASGGSASGARSGATSDDEAAIREAIELLFAPDASIDDKLARLADSGDLRQLMEEGQQDPRAAVLSLEVTGIVFHDADADAAADAATATIDFFLRGSIAMSDAVLDLVRVDGAWLVRRDSYCRLRATSAPPCPDPPSSATGATPTLTSSDRLVPGSRVTITIRGLDRLRQRPVELTVRTDGPVETSGGMRPGYMGMGEGTVDGDGTLIFAAHVPNSLSGEDDIIALEPGQDYVLAVGASKSDAPEITMPFRVDGAIAGGSYDVVAGRGPATCGAPPLEIGFDGDSWLPESQEHFPATQDLFEGVLILTTADEGTFTSSDGDETVFARSTRGWAC